MALAPSTPFFQEFHAVLREDALGLLMRPMNDLAVVEGLKAGKGGDPGAAAKAGVTAGSILVAVNGAEVWSESFEAAIALVKKAGRPVRLGFRRLHAVRDPGFGPGRRRMWQGYLFARFSAGRSWTGRFYVLREDGELRAYAGKECSEHAAESRVPVRGSVRSGQRDVAEAARACGDLGDDGRGSLGPLAFAVPVYTAEGGEMRWEFFRAESAESKLDWVAALTTLAVAAKLQYVALLDEDDETQAVGSTITSRRLVLRQGYLWMKAPASLNKTQSSDVGTLAASAALDLATRLEPWRRRWVALCAVSTTRECRLVWYTAPPDDESEVPNGSCDLDGALVSVASSDDDPPLHVLETTPDDDDFIPPPDDADELQATPQQHNGSRKKRYFDFKVLEKASRVHAKALKLRALSAEDGAEWVRVLRASSTRNDRDNVLGNEAVRHDASKRSKRLRVMEREPQLVLREPESAFSLLVPVDRHGGVDKSEWRAVAGQHFPTLCDVYTADVVFDALAASNSSVGASAADEEAKSSTSARSLRQGVETGSSMTSAGSALLKKVKRSSASSSKIGGDALPAVDDEDYALAAALGGTNTKFGKELAATYASARVAAKRFSADAGARVSELLYESAHASTATGREAATRRAQADLETSRRRAVPIADGDRRLTYDAFKRYCNALKLACHKPDRAWDTLRVRLGIDDLETLILKEDGVADHDDPHHTAATAYLTDRHLMVHNGRANVVKVIDLASIQEVAEADDEYSPEVLDDASTSWYSIRLRGADVLAVPLASRGEDHSGDVSKSQGSKQTSDNPGRSFVSSGTSGKAAPSPLPAPSQLPGRQVSGPKLPRMTAERAFWDAILYGGSGRRRRGSEDDADDESVDWTVDDAVASHVSPAAAATGTRHGGDADWSDVEDDVLGIASRYSGVEARRKSEFYALVFPKLSKRHTSKSRERLRHWLDAMRELVAAAALDEQMLTENAATPFGAWVCGWFDVRADARRFDSQRAFFESGRRRVSLWAAVNLIRRDALFRGCGKAPKQLLACSVNRPLLDAYLQGEQRGDMVDASWLRSVVCFVSRSVDLEQRARNEIELFSPARFRDEWYVFWNHVDPIWDGCFDTIASLRRWDRPAVSAVVFLSLLFVAILDKLNYLPSIFFAVYAIAVVANGERAAKCRDFRRNRLARALRNTATSRSSPDDGPSIQPEATGPLAAWLVPEINKHPVGRKLCSVIAKLLASGTHGTLASNVAAVKGANQAKSVSQQQLQPETDISVPARARSSQKSMDSTSSATSGGGVFRQLRELKTGLDKAQACIHDYNTTLVKCRALHRWADPKRTRLFVLLLAATAVIFATLPLNFLFGFAVCYIFSDPLFTTRGVSRAIADEFVDGLPVASRTHGNVYFAAKTRHERARFRTIFPPLFRRRPNPSSPKNSRPAMAPNMRSESSALAIGPSSGSLSSTVLERRVPDEPGLPRLSLDKPERPVPTAACADRL